MSDASTIASLTAAFDLACSIANEANAAYDANFLPAPKGDVTFAQWFDKHAEPTSVIPEHVIARREAAITLRELARRSLNDAKDGQD